LSKEGNRFVADQVIAVLKTKLAHLPDVFPDWKDVDPKNPEKNLCDNCKDFATLKLRVETNSLKFI